MLAPTSEIPRDAARAPGWASLLERFYLRLGLPLPAIHELGGEDVPQPYRGMLVHSSDMTPTLELFYQQPMSLSVLSREQQDYAYLREVILKCSNDRRPVEYGVIRISLNHLPAPARLHVLEEQKPLGSILQSETIAHLSWPQAFFRLQSDPHLAHVLHCRQPEQLYGRRNVLLDGSRRLLAEVIEILAPVP